MVLDIIDSNVMSVPARRHVPTAIVFMSVQFQLKVQGKVTMLIFGLFSFQLTFVKSRYSYLNRGVGNNVMVTNRRTPGDLKRLGGVHVHETNFEMIVVF